MKLVLISLLFILTSCAEKYGIIGGAQKSTVYYETTSWDYSMGFESYEIDYKNKSDTYFIGMSFENDIFIGKFSYFKSSYKDKLIDENGTDQIAKYNENGFELTYSFPYKWLQPLAGVRLIKNDFESSNQSSFERTLFFVIGLDVEYKFNERFALYAGYHYDIEMMFLYSSANDEKKYHSNIVAGFRFIVF
ncbi:hypothetical protein ABMA70_07820 [Halobacteriovorax sp. XZX-3]|uniref:hypothetical protein n=1 Tax=unclassified Halobacteriovorax TaxID=2639665 RepID=UPI0037193445